VRGQSEEARVRGPRQDADCDKHKWVR
jgi:hypothetical protein